MKVQVGLLILFSDLHFVILKTAAACCIPCIVVYYHCCLCALCCISTLLKSCTKFNVLLYQKCIGYSLHDIGIIRNDAI